MASVLTREQKQLALRLRVQGLSLVAIARQVGCSAPMVGLMVRDGRFLSGVSDATDWPSARRPNDYFRIPRCAPWVGGFDVYSSVK